MDGKYIKSAFKVFVLVLIVALIFQLVSFGVYYYNRRNFGKRGDLQIERERCEQVIEKQDPQDLTDYSYCKRFIEWLNKNQNLD